MPYQSPHGASTSVPSSNCSMAADLHRSRRTEYRGVAVRQLSDPNRAPLYGTEPVLGPSVTESAASAMRKLAAAVSSPDQLDRRTSSPGDVRLEPRSPVELDAANTSPGRELRRHATNPEPVDDTADEREIQAADQIGVVGGQSIEGAVGQLHCAARPLRLVTVAGQHGNGALESLAVGVIEILAGVLVAFRPAIGGYVVAAWLLGIIVNLVTMGDYYDIALRDFGLLLAALALARLASSAAGRPQPVSE